MHRLHFIRSLIIPLSQMFHMSTKGFGSGRHCCTRPCPVNLAWSSHCGGPPAVLIALHPRDHLLLGWLRRFDLCRLRLHPACRSGAGCSSGGPWLHQAAKGARLVFEAPPRRVQHLQPPFISLIHQHLQPPYISLIHQDNQRLSRHTQLPMLSLTTITEKQFKASS